MVLLSVPFFVKGCEGVVSGKEPRTGRPASVFFAQGSPWLPIVSWRSAKGVAVAQKKARRGREGGTDHRQKNVEKFNNNKQGQRRRKGVSVRKKVVGRAGRTASRSDSAPPPAHQDPPKLTQWQRISFFLELSGVILWKKIRFSRLSAQTIYIKLTVHRDDTERVRTVTAPGGFPGTNTGYLLGTRHGNETGGSSRNALCTNNSQLSLSFYWLFLSHG